MLFHRFEANKRAFRIFLHQLMVILWGNFFVKKHQIPEKLSGVGQIQCLSFERFVDVLDDTRYRYNIFYFNSKDILIRIFLDFQKTFFSHSYFFFSLFSKLTKWSYFEDILTFYDTKISSQKNHNLMCGFAKTLFYGFIRCFSIDSELIDVLHVFFSN